MTSIVFDIKHLGNNVGVRLPAAIARAAHLHADQRVSITLEGEWVIITPMHGERLTLEQRLAWFDPERHGGEAMTAEKAHGAEQWWKHSKPNRQDVIWIDCNPQRGQEMRDVHPFPVLSSKAFNERTSLVIGLPMTTAAYNADNPLAWP